MKKLMTVFLILFIALSCNKKETVAPNYNGVAQTLGNGKVYTWLKMNAAGNPSSLGITFTKGSFEGLSHATATEIVVPLAADAVGKTPFDHVFLSFSHSGHEPVGIYDLAHFDLHFVTQPLAERNAIGVYGPATAAKFDNVPPDGIMPVPYFKLPAGVPLMGAHWANPTSPELNGAKFTETFIMGSYDGKLTFYEPMITLDLLSSKPNITKAAPIPTKFAKPGYFPMKYSIKQAGDDVEVSLDELMMMQ